jgi:predicted DNA-binding protein
MVNEDRAMTKTPDETVEWLIDVVQQAIEQGQATAAELEDWLLAAIALEDMAHAEERDAQEARAFNSWMPPGATVH